MLPPPPPEEIGSDAVTRGQKCKQEEEGFVGEGSGKNNNFNFTDYLNDSDMEADGEQWNYEEGSEEGEVGRKARGRWMKGRSKEKRRMLRRNKRRKQMWMTSTISMWMMIP